MIVRALVVILWGLVPSTALADYFAARGENTPTVNRVDALLSSDGRDGFKLVEKLRITQIESRQFVWLKAFPSRPEVLPGSDPFAKTIEAAVHIPSHAEQLRAHPFGPSLLSVLTRSWGWKVRTRSAKAPLQVPSLQILEAGVFDGPAKMSVETGQMEFPARLESFLHQRGMRLSKVRRRLLASYLNRGWSIVAMVVLTPEGAKEASLGPIELRFSSGQPKFPLGRGQLNEDIHWSFSLLAPKTYVPLELGSIFSPWGGQPPDGVVSEVVYTAPLSATPELAFSLVQDFQVAKSENLWLTQIHLKKGSFDLDLLSFGEPQQAVSIRQLRPNFKVPTAGRGWDLTWCLFLGFLPLVLTPESWVIFWAQEKARHFWRSRLMGGHRFEARSSRTNEGGAGVISRYGAFVVHAWALWALLVGAYWLYSLDSLAKVAALGPLVIGAIQLSFPFSGYETPRVRANLGKRARREGGNLRQERVPFR